MKLTKDSKLSRHSRQDSQRFIASDSEVEKQLFALLDNGVSKGFLTVSEISEITGFDRSTSRGCARQTLQVIARDSKGKTAILKTSVLRTVLENGKVVPYKTDKGTTCNESAYLICDNNKVNETCKFLASVINGFVIQDKIVFNNKEKRISAQGSYWSNKTFFNHLVESGSFCEREKYSVSAQKKIIKTWV